MPKRDLKVVNLGHIIKPLILWPTKTFLNNDMLNRQKLIKLFLILMALNKKILLWINVHRLNMINKIMKNQYILEKKG